MGCKKRSFYLLLLLVFSCLYGTAQLQANFSASPVSGCAPIRVVFKDSTSGNPTSWKWDLGNSTVSALQNPSVTYFNPGVYTVKLTVYNATDSSSITKTNIITVYANPVADFDAGPLGGCYPLQVTFNDLSSAGAGSTTSSWQWDYGDGNISNQQIAAHTYTASGLFNVSLTVKNNNGCTRTLTRPNLVNVSEGVRADFTNSIPAVCLVPASVAFTNLSTGAGINNYFWDFGDGTSSLLPSPVHLYTIAAAYTVKLVVKNSSGCTDTIIKNNLVSVGVIKSAFGNPDTVCLNTPTLFTNLSTPAPGIIASAWSFGDGSLSNVLNPLKTYTSNGSFTVKLVTDFGLCKDSSSKLIQVLPKPLASFTATNTLACRPPLSASFTNTSNSGTVVKWYFGDGDSSSLSNPVHVYQSAGLFPVSLIIRNSSGCTDTLTQPGFVNVSPPDITAISPLPAKGCVPFPINFQPSISSVDPIAAYEWDLGDGSSSMLANPSHTYSTEGVYQVSLKVTSASGCTDTFLLTPAVFAGNKPVANFTATPRITCAYTPVIFTDNSTNGPDEWLWDFGDSTTSTDQNPGHYYSDTGYFSITLVVSRNGCSDTIRRPNYVYIKPPISGFVDSFLCADQSKHYFVDHSIGATSWTYWFGDGDSSNLLNPVHVYRDTGRYIVRQRVSDSLCFHETKQTILVLNEKADFSISDSIGCKSTVKEFIASANAWNIKNYHWDFGDRDTLLDTLGLRIRHRYDSTGLFRAKLRITDLNNCPDSVIKPVAVSVYGPKASFGPFQKVCKGVPVVFQDSSNADLANPITEWTWDFGDSTARQTFSAPPFTHTYSRAGLYSVKLSVRDAAGCSDSILKTLNIRVNEVTANFSSPDTIKCSNSAVRFFYNGTGSVTSVSWDFGDNTGAAILNPTHIYSQNGYYDIRLKAVDEAGCADSVTKPRFIRIVNATADFAMSDSFTTCPPLFLGITNRSVNASQSNWNFGDGNTSTVVNPSHTYTFSGNFNVQLVVTGNGGCKDSISKTVKILGPTGALTYNPVLGCAPLQVSFSSNSVNTYFYTWDYNDGSTTFVSDTIATHTYTGMGSYLPKIILEDSLGCKLPILGIDSIRVKGVKTRIRNLSKYVLCDSATIQFADSTITNDIIQRYQWNFGDGMSSSLRNPVHSYTRNGLFTVSLTVTTATGCVSTDTLRVPVKIVPAPVIGMAGDTVGCVPKSARYSGQWLNQDTSVVSWKWDLGNGQTSTLQDPPAQLYSVAGNYTISSIARNGSGCSDTVLRSLTVFPLPVVDAGAGRFICRGNISSLIATGALNYVWDTQPSLSCTNCSSPLANPGLDTRYRVTGTDQNGCIDSGTVMVRVKQPFLVKVSPGDTLCAGQQFRLAAFGAEQYNWSPATYLNTTNISNPVSNPAASITYRVIGSDTLGCFHDTGFVVIKVYPIPTVDITETVIRVPAGNSVQLITTNSGDVTRWRWTPPQGLTCTDCPCPVASPKLETVYTLRVTNAGHCTAEDQVRVIMICNGNNIFIPNTFSPNGDGANDLFYPRGKALFGIKSMRIFDRWGEKIFEKNSFQANDPTAAWDGTYHLKMLTPDVYVYLIEAICDNNEIISIKGNVTLLK